MTETAQETVYSHKPRHGGTRDVGTIFLCICMAIEDFKSFHSTFASYYNTCIISVEVNVIEQRRSSWHIHHQHGARPTNHFELVKVKERQLHTAGGLQYDIDLWLIESHINP